MANWRGHLMGGTFACGALVALRQSAFPNTRLSLRDLLLFLLASLLGALFPDIDIYSKGQKIWYRLIAVALVVAVIYAQWTGVFLLLFAALFPLFVSHRGITHSLLFTILAPLGLPYLAFHYHQTLFSIACSCYLYFVAGALSHLLLDFGPRNVTKVFSKKWLFRSKNRSR